MDKDKQRDIASKGGRESRGNFGNDRERASEAGRNSGGGQRSSPRSH
jgi:general stress protein YciG